MITWAHQQHPQLSIRRLCDLLEVNRKGYYDHLRKQVAGQDHPLTSKEDEVALREEIERLVLEFPGYGYRRVTIALQRKGWQVNHKRVLRIMREESLLCQLKRRWVATTDSEHAHKIYPNLLKGKILDGLDQAWVVDITYIRLPKGFCYLAAVLDAFSRKCIGYVLSKWIDTNLALNALNMALAERQPQAGFIDHSDRGVQYASTAYTQRLKEVGGVISMSAKGNCYDNAKAESFFKTLKREEVYLKEYESFEEASSNVTKFIEQVYNTKRLHSSLGYWAPVHFELNYAISKSGDTCL